MLLDAILSALAVFGGTTRLGQFATLALVLGIVALVVSALVWAATQ